MFDVSCVGILTADVSAKPVEKLPSKGLLDKISSIQLFLGGCAANAAVDMAKLGVKVQIFGKIGQDHFGTFVKSELDRAGVLTDGLAESHTSQTSASVVAVSSDGERSVIHCVGANGEFCLEDIDFEKIQKSKILFIAGTFLMPSFDGTGAASLLRMAKEEGILCCLDTAWDTSGDWMQKLSCCMPYLDWFMPSYEEAVQLSGKRKPEEMAEIFLRMGAGSIVIKLGASGCYVKQKDQDGYFVRAYNDIAAADTSGAGDSFCAGFLTGLLEGWEPEKCARFANAVGRFCVASIGATTGIPSKEEIIAYMESQTVKDETSSL